MGSPRIDPQWQGLWPRSQHLKRWCKAKQGDAKFEAGGGDNGHHGRKSSNELKFFLRVRHYPECLACIHARMPSVML